MSHEVTRIAYGRATADLREADAELAAAGRRREAALQRLVSAQHAFEAAAFTAGAVAFLLGVPIGGCPYDDAYREAVKAWRLAWLSQRYRTEQAAEDARILALRSVSLGTIKSQPIPRSH